MNNTIISALDEQFKKDCKVINLKYEYPGYTGVEQWAIITDLSEDELCTKYAEQVAPFSPSTARFMGVATSSVMTVLEILMLRTPTNPKLLE